MTWPLLLNTTTYCNANCKFCMVYAKLNHPELNMTDEQIYESLRNSRAAGSTEVGYSGGEPSIDPRIVDIVRYAKELGYTHQSMNTNGIRFKQTKFCRDIIEAGLTSVDISIHGHTDDLHNDLVNRKGALAAIREACANLRELRKTHKLHLSATVVITRHNHRFLRDICVFLDSLGISNKRLKYAYEGHMTHETIIDQVAPYEEVLPSITHALDYLAFQTSGFGITHIPLCLLGDHAVFSLDFERRTSRMVFDDQSIVGEAAHHLRQDGDKCARCSLNNMCTRLDGGYEKFHGRPNLIPFENPEQVDALFERGLARFPRAGGVIRRSLDMYQRNRDVAAPVQFQGSGESRKLPVVPRT